MLSGAGSKCLARMGTGSVVRHEPCLWEGCRAEGRWPRALPVGGLQGRGEVQASRRTFLAA